MSDGTAIEWTDASWNPVRAERTLDDFGDTERKLLGWHCEHVSEGCRNCYAETFNRRLGTKLHYKPGLRRELRIFLDEQSLLQPLKWRKPRKIFVCSMTDLFADFVPDEWIDRMFAIMAMCPQHVFQVLTKRPERLRRYFTHPSDIDGAGQERGRELEVYEQWRLMRDKWRLADPWTQEWDWSFREPGLGGCQAAFPLSNVWLGVSVENQAAADERIPLLLQTPAAVRWLSCEPLLGPLDLTMIQFPNSSGNMECWDALDLHLEGEPLPDGDCGATLDWVVAGGESGPGARPMHPAWARSLRDQCASAGVPFLFKQWGSHRPTSDQNGEYMMRSSKKAAGRLLDGVQYDGFPA